MTDDLQVERDGPIALLTVDRPDARNAMTFESYLSSDFHEGVRAFLDKRKPD
jgi:enoyl-CoA hydratase/carnithine racemase